MVIINEVKIIYLQFCLIKAIQVLNLISVMRRFESLTSPPSLPPRATPRAFELLKIGLFKFPPIGAKKSFKSPTNWY